MDLEEPTNSQIAQERVQPGAASLLFWGLACAVGLLGFAVAALAGLQPAASLGAERAAAGNPGSLYYPVGLAGARLASALAVGLSAVATAHAGRRLFHSDGVGLLAALLLALDPGLVAAGRIATPEALAIAAGVAALAAFLAPRGWMHWLAAGAVAVAALLDPRAMLWAVPLGLLALLRGHIYAAPRHLGVAALQTLGAAAAGALLNLLSGSVGWSFVPCQPPVASALTLSVAPSFGGVAATHNPVTWFGGMGAVAVMGAAAAYTALRQVRIARLPGRLQVRLAQPLPSLHGRVLWLLLLALAAPFPAMWLPVFALALAAGIGELADDAPGFGLAVAFVAVAFAAIALGRAWPAVAGTGDAADALRGIVPWTRLVPCP